MEAPPTRLVNNPVTEEDTALPEREVLTPMGKSRFRNRHLEEKGYRCSFSRGCDNRLLEIVYLRRDGTTGTIIADIDTLFDIRVSKDAQGKTTMFHITWKLLPNVSNPVDLYKADVPAEVYNKSGLTGDLLLGLLEYFLGGIFGKDKV